MIIFQLRTRCTSVHWRHAHHIHQHVLPLNDSARRRRLRGNATFASGTAGIACHHRVDRRTGAAVVCACDAETCDTKSHGEKIEKHISSTRMHRRHEDDYVTSIQTSYSFSHHQNVGCRRIPDFHVYASFSGSLVSCRRGMHCCSTRIGEHNQYLSGCRHRFAVHDGDYEHVQGGYREGL